jgi:hypothetical protein
LIVGAGPTGLTLAAQLSMFGVRFRIVDRAPTAAHESRALAVQARTLEILQTLGLGEALVARGNPSARLALHFDGKPAAHVQLGGFAADDTRFPFILFVSQAETEALLGAHLERGGTTIERGVALVSAETRDSSVRCVLRGPDGAEETLRARFLVGCDGAHSAVRKQAGIPFEGEGHRRPKTLRGVSGRRVDMVVEGLTADSSAGDNSAEGVRALSVETWTASRRGRAGDRAERLASGPNCPQEADGPEDDHAADQDRARCLHQPCASDRLCPFGPHSGERHGDHEDHGDAKGSEGAHLPRAELRLMRRNTSNRTTAPTKATKIVDARPLNGVCR